MTSATIFPSPRFRRREFQRSALQQLASLAMSTPVPTCEELVASLKRREVPPGGFEEMAFTLPGSGADAPRIEARMARADDPATSMAVPAALKRAIETHLLGLGGCIHLESVTEEQLGVLPTTTVYPAGFPMVILYIYPFKLNAGIDWVYETPSPDGLTVRDIVRCIASTYRVMYAAEEAAVGPEAHAARASSFMLNRGRTDGPFGIWGHDLRDLVLQGFTWAPNVNNSGGAILPRIGS